MARRKTYTYQTKIQSGGKNKRLSIEIIKKIRDDFKGDELVEVSLRKLQ